MTFEQLAGRLAGGLIRPVDDDALRFAIKAALPEVALGELDGIKELPGVINTAADSLRKTWRAGIDLSSQASEHPRINSMAILEEAVMGALPLAMMRPVDLVTAGRARLSHVPALFGPIDIVGITELSPVWRPLLHAVASQVPVRWISGPRSVPNWLDSELIEVVRAPALTPAITTSSAATTYHEAVEALRWARQLIASGDAQPADIAIASVSPADYDDHFLALRADANFDLHFVHGVKVTASREGQAAASLADVLLRGLSQTRIRRLNTLLRAYHGPFRSLPEGWTRILPSDAPLSSLEAWIRLIEGLSDGDWPFETGDGSALGAIVNLLAKGIDTAEQAGEGLLTGKVLEIWRRALAKGAAASLDLNLEVVRQDDGLEASVSVCWMPASSLAASPRRYVRLLGLNTGRWPRRITEDRLLSDHIIPTTKLDPLPVATADRRDLETILSTTEGSVVLSRARRDEQGRLLGRSALLLQAPTDEIYLRRNAVPKHAFSETDRLMARPGEFRGLLQAQFSSTCWRNWWSSELTPHDGMVRADHPLLLAILERTQSARSLRQLLRNPLGFVWRYALRWHTPERVDDPLTLSALMMGDLVHQILNRTLESLEANGGLAHADEELIAATVESASEEVARLWEYERSIPPAVVWRRTLNDVRGLGAWALAFRDENMPDARSHSEVPFGGMEPKSDTDVPWDHTASVEIPGTCFHIRGYIDRLDIASDGLRAIVRDYKTGRVPNADIVLDKGRELQRCIYAFAATSLLGGETSIDASLLYPRDQKELRLDDLNGALHALSGFLQSAFDNLAAGGALMGPDTGDKYDDLAFALPANAQATYCERKRDAAKEYLGAAVNVWEAP